MKKRFLLAGLLIVLMVVAMVAAACGTEETTTTAPPATTPATTATTAAPSSDTTAPASTDTTAAATKEDVLKFGAISSGTGDMAPAFKAMYDSVKPTEDLLNEMGGITIGDTHYTIEIVYYDDQSTTAGGVSAANKLIEDGVKYVVSADVHAGQPGHRPALRREQDLPHQVVRRGRSRGQPRQPAHVLQLRGRDPLHSVLRVRSREVPQRQEGRGHLAGRPGCCRPIRSRSRPRTSSAASRSPTGRSIPQPSFDFYAILNKALRDQAGCHRLHLRHPAVHVGHHQPVPRAWLRRPDLGPVHARRRQRGQRHDQQARVRSTTSCRTCPRSTAIR